ncbi:TetR/AcrR family transcriptional regulator [Actinomadura sp. 3N407]|uniref:TetR/AcrR family transcriptional regulator n=1 Tax=Actinomadura sp. 3N407 TaxID=3457423 RepID=UPI003FCED032
MTDAHGDHRPEGDTAGPMRPPRPSGGSVQPRRDRREQTRTALLTAAERLWAERGIHGASLDDIAAAAGLTKGAVYSNFAGKTDLLLALMERFTNDRSIDVCDELRAAEEDADTTARSSPRQDTDDHARRIALLLVEFWLYGMRDYAAGWRIADWYAERRAQMASQLETTDGIPPDERATLALALDVGLAFQHLLDPARVPADLYSTGKNLMLGREQC